jgi:hypothetical protein
MSKFDKALDESKAIEASQIPDASTPWKERIVEFMTSSPQAAHTPHEILEATDPKYDPKSTDKSKHFPARKHCLDSQLTYITQDYDIRRTWDGDKVVLLGVVRNEKLIPFKNAVKYLK